MEIAESTQNKVENETLEVHKSPIKDNVDNGGGDIASNKKPIENNDVQKVTPKSRKMTKLERMSQENAALLKELGVNPADDNSDSGRRRTRSQARGITTTPAPIEEKPKRGRKTKEQSDSSGSNKKSTPPPSGETETVQKTGQKRGRGRPPKNVPSPKKLKDKDNVVDDNVAEMENSKKEEPTHPELNEHEVDNSEKKVVREEVENKEEEKVSPMEATELEKPKEEPEPKTTTANIEQKTNGEENTEKEKSEKYSEPQPMDTKPTEGSETLTTPNEN